MRSHSRRERSAGPYRSSIGRRATAPIGSVRTGQRTLDSGDVPGSRSHDSDGSLRCRNDTGIRDQRWRAGVQSHRPRTRARWRVVEEGPEEPHRAELHREAQPHTVPALGADQLAVGVIQVEVPRELVRARLACIAAIAPLLLIGKKRDRHGARGSAGEQLFGARFGPTLAVDIGVKRAERDPELPGDVGRDVAPVRQHRHRRAQLGARLSRGRPPVRPRARAAARPAIVRSRIRSRSNSDRVAKMPNTSRPVTLVVSVPPVSTFSQTPRF